jgi:hypothetical protein
MNNVIPFPPQDFYSLRLAWLLEDRDKEGIPLPEDRHREEMHLVPYREFDPPRRGMPGYEISYKKRKGQWVEVHTPTW